MPVRRKPVPRHVIHLLSVALVLSSGLHVSAQDSDSFDCHFSAGELRYDLSVLEGTKVLNRTRESPPTTYEDELRFNLCADLAEVENRASDEQCLPGSRACLTTINRKAGNERITAIVPIAVSSSLHVETAALSSPNGVAITLHGASYPPSSPNSVRQSLKVQLTCAESTTDPQFSSYENGQVLVEWSASAACGTTESPKKDESGGRSGGDNREGEAPIESVGSGLGFFFLMLIMAFMAYFALGAYYNYSTYGARGWDLIPHRDFWREVPYMVQDVIAHLCSNVRTRRSGRGGYISV